MGPAVKSIAVDEKAPDRVDVVIIGGGIIGAASAFFLANKGISVAICEKGDIAGEQSSRNWGWIRKAKRDPRELPLMFESARLWEGMNGLVEAETGYRKSAHLFAAETDKSIQKYEEWIEQARDYQVGARMISGDELERVMPGAKKHWKAALYSPEEAQAEPQYAAPVIAEAARKKGAVLLTRCAVRGIETAGGDVSAVVTENGRISCSTVVVCAGAWSSRFLRDMGLRLPQLKVRSSVLRTTPMEGPEGVALWCKEASVRKRFDGGYTIGIGFTATAAIVPDSFRYFREFLPILKMEWSSTRIRFERASSHEWSDFGRSRAGEISRYEKIRVLDPAPDEHLNARAFRGIANLFPVFEHAKIAQQWAGMIDVTPDMLPVISAVDGVPGLVVATGFCGHGFGIGPGVGQLVADLVTNATPRVDASHFRFSRFSDGSDIRPVTGL